MKKTLMIGVKGLLCSFLLLFATTMNAQNETAKINLYNFGDAAGLYEMSSNGDWALAFSNNQDAETPARIVNLTTRKYSEIPGEGITVSAITDDGNIVAGSLKAKPAYYNKTTGEWTVLPMPAGYVAGVLRDITADGKYAIGTLCQDTEDLINSFFFNSAMWDLTTNTIVTLPNMPTKDRIGEISTQVRYTSISDDARFIVVQMSYSYPEQTIIYVYDRVAESARPLGYSADGKPLVKGLVEVGITDTQHMSPNGKWITGTAFITDGTDDIGAACVYNTETDEFTVYKYDAEGMMPFAVDNEGTVYAATPAGVPLRDWAVRSGDYWYPVSQILKQKFGIDFYETTKLDLTGTPFAVSGDGKKFIVMADPQVGGGYFLEVSEPLNTVCADLNILGDYAVTPAAGASFARPKNFSVTFNRDVEYVGDYKTIKLYGENGQEMTASSTAVKVNPSDPKTLQIGFFPRSLNAGERYTLVVPAGTVCVAGDNTKTNDEIKVQYVGRANEPLKVVNVYPADGSDLMKIDYNGSPIIITFDSRVVAPESTAGKLELVDGDDVTFICNLNVAYEENGNNLAVYPPTEQNLFLGSNYRVTVNAGAVTDVMGDCGSEEIVLNYKGIYERKVSSDDAVIFSDDFSNPSQSRAQFLLYEGDHNTPTSDMAAIEFDNDNTPWHLYLLESSGSTDGFAGSHSTYSPAGKSDDWMMTPQLFIPASNEGGDNCKLMFDAQSYKKSCNDRLKVVIWENKDNVQVLSDEIMSRVKAECKVVFDEQLSAGATDANQSGEWTKYVIDLDEYAGKDIHIAFVNENENQSMVFVDNIVVMRNMNYLLSLNNDETVVAKEEISIAGKLTINSETDTYSSVKLVLKDAEGKVIDEISENGLSLKKDDDYRFAFSKPLPLAIGAINKYYIEVTLNDYSDVFTGKIVNLTFNPIKNVILEEYTGTTCGNCPQGIIAIEELRKIYGDRIIPISIHTYSGDSWGSGLIGYSNQLGLNAAPSGIVNRSGEISSPMWTNPGTGDAELSNGVNLWLDLVGQELKTPAEAEIKAEVEKGNSDNTFTVPVTVRYAMSAKSLNLNIFAVLMEDGLVAFQENYFSKNPDPAFGKWGMGGIYGQSTVYNVTHEDVVRSYYGSVYGTPGLLPQEMEAGKEYTIKLENLQIPAAVENKDNAKVAVMLLDANTGKVINAACVKLNGTSGIENVAGNGCTIEVKGDCIVANASGKVSVQLYSTSGTLLNSANGEGSATVSTKGYHGAVIVKVADGKNVTVKKIIL